MRPTLATFYYGMATPKQIGLSRMAVLFLGAHIELNFKVNINTHSMRKTYGYHAYENGADIHYLQALFNHYSSRVTLKYIGVTKTEIEKMYFDHALEIA